MSKAEGDERKPLKVVVTVLVVVVLAGAVVGFVFTHRGRVPSETFCTMGLAMGSVHGRMVVLQDQGGPGRDGCDLPDHGSDTDIGPTLGFDCKVRDRSGRVVDSLPELPDGTCDAGDQS